MNIDELNTQLDYLAETKEQIKSAITNKGQEIISETPFREYVEKINNISTLQADTADANAIALDIALDKTAYVNGEKITGTLRETSSVFFRAESVTLDDEHNIVKSQGPNNYSGESVIMSNGATGWTEIPYQILADTIGVTAEKIAQGNTILGIEGTASTGGLDTSDATALTSDICIGKTAYVNGQKITGDIQEIVAEQGIQLVSDGTLGTYPDENQVSFITNISSNMLFRENSIIEIKKNNSELANQIGLTPDIIKKGVTILGITGTYEAEVEAQEQIATLTNTIDESNTIAEDILGTTI